MASSQIGRRYRRYILGVLVATYAIGFVDRQILGILLQPIKVELNITDVQLGLLSGLAFGLLYASLGLPAARWADHGNRRNILSLAIAVFSLFTAVSSIVSSYVQLVLVRGMVGVGEAAGAPPALSMLADLYPPKRRATAMGIFASGTSIGLVIGLLLGGWVGEFYGWRMALLTAGVPGLVLAFLIRVTLPEPQRRSDHGAAQMAVPSLSETVGQLWRQRSTLLITLATSVSAVGSFGIATWFPSYLVRSYHMPLGEIGTWMAIIAGTFGIAGAWLPPWIADRYFPDRPGRKLWVPATVLILSLPCIVLIATATSGVIALAAYSGAAAAAGCYLGISFSLIQSVVVPRMRGVSVAVLQFGINVIGLSAGPWVIGAVSDALRPVQGAESLRAGLLSMAAFYLLGAGLFLFAGRRVAVDLGTLRAMTENSNVYADGPDPLEPMNAVSEQSAG